MNIEELYQQDKDEALDALCEAFYDYPVMRYVLSDTGGDYDIHLRAMIDSFCENRLGRGQPIYAIRAADQTIAVAVVSSPVRIPDTPELRDLHIRFDQLLGDAAVDRLGKYDDLCIAGEPDRPHHYLGMLGVRTRHQGQGLGRSLVEHVKNIVRGDETSEGICLNTETENNIPIYKRLGFRILSEARLDGLHTRCMFWESD